MSAANLIQELQGNPVEEPLDWISFSAKVNEEFAAAPTSQERGDLLATRAVAMEIVVRQLELHGEQYEKFIDACELEYKRLIVQETLVDGAVSYEEMLHVTDREIAAGRMSDDYALRAIALEECHLEPRAQAADEAPSHAMGAFAKLKYWLHND